MATADDDVV